MCCTVTLWGMTPLISSRSLFIRTCKALPGGAARARTRSNAGQGGPIIPCKGLAGELCCAEAGHGVYCAQQWCRRDAALPSEAPQRCKQGHIPTVLLYVQLRFSVRWSQTTSWMSF